jgi:hypothetical protein
MNKYTVVFKNDVDDSKIVFADRSYVDEDWTTFYNEAEDKDSSILRVASSEILLIETEFNTEK